MKSFINFLPPWVETNIQPAFYDKESGSVLQQTARMYAKVNQLIRKFNELSEEMQGYIQQFIDLKNYVDDYFDNLDVQEEINNKLDVMAEDGTLAELINEEVFDRLNNGYYNKSNTINYRRFARILKINENHPNHTSSDFHTMQGGVYVGNNIMFQSCIGGANAKIEKLNLASGNTIDSNTLPIYHANSIAYNATEDKLYIASLTYDGAYLPYLYIVDATSLTIEETITFDLESNVGVHSVAYDEVTEKYYIGTETQTTNEFTLYEWNTSDNSLTEIPLVNYDAVLGTGTGTNDICVYDNILYILKHNPKTITTYNLESKEVVQIYNIKSYNNQGFEIGEPENITYDVETGDLVIGAWIKDGRDGWYDRWSFFRVNLAHDLLTAFNNSANVNYGEQDIYIDNSVTDVNPTGSATHPFATINEALEILNRDYIKHATFYVKAGTYPYSCIIGRSNFDIRGYDVDHRENQIVSGMDIEGCSNFLVTALTITAQESSTYDCNIKRSNGYITACAFGGNKDCHIYAQQSDINFITLIISTGILFHFAADCVINPLEIGTTTYSCENKAPLSTKKLHIGNFGSLSNTMTEISYANVTPLIETGSSKLMAVLTSSGGTAIQEFNTQTNDGGSRNLCFSVDSKLITVTLTFDKTNKKLKGQITKAIDIKSLTPTDITSTASGSLRLWFEG